jgi:hypothetical protein
MAATDMIPGLSGVLGFAGGLQSQGIAKNIRHFVNDLSTRHLAENKGHIRRSAADVRKAAKKARGKAVNQARTLRDMSYDTAADARDANLDIFGDAQRRGLNALRGDRETGLADITDTRGRNLATVRGARDESLRYFNPAIRTGRNALGAVSDTLGLSNGGYNLSLTPQTQYLMEQGRDTVEGGAAGGGGLYSGETLAELEKMRTGLVAQDRDSQIAQLMGLVGTGQTAGANAATVRGQASDDIVGIRNDATQAGLGLRGATTGGMNALRGFYSPLMAGENSDFAGRMDLANRNYATGMTGAFDTEAARNIQNAQWRGGNIVDANHQRINQYLGIAAPTLGVQSQAIQNGADYLAAGAIGTGNAINQGINNGAYGQGVANPTGQQPWITNPYRNSQTGLQSNNQYTY